LLPDKNNFSGISFFPGQTGANNLNFMMEDILSKLTHIAVGLLKRRVQEHNTGKVFSTKSRRPFCLLYFEAYLAEDDARKREASLKLRGQARSHLLKRMQKSLLQCES